jgi:succinate dehydrogenase / fumarate reductase membrane anchor subunit
MTSKTPQMQTPLKRARGWGAAKDGTHHFIWQRVTAIATAVSGLWLLGMLLALRSADYAIIHGLVADPVNASVLVAFLLGMFWHARLGLQVIVEDYVHTPVVAVVLQLAILFVCALAAIAGVLAVLRVALGS